jgi:hypothetical protein
MGSNCRRRSDAGQDVVEYALVLPLLLLLLFGIVEFGWAVFAYNTVANAAREVARCCIIPYPDATDPTTQISRCQIDGELLSCEQAAVDHYSTAVNLVPGVGGNFTFVPYDPADPDPDLCARCFRVEVTYQHQLITGYIAGVLGLPPDSATFTLKTMATMRAE